MKMLLNLMASVCVVLACVSIASSQGGEGETTGACIDQGDRCAARDSWLCNTISSCQSTNPPQHSCHCKLVPLLADRCYCEAS